MYEKMKPGVSEYGHLENVNRKINSHIHSEVSVKTILLFEFCATCEILICFSLIKRFPNDQKDILALYKCWYCIQWLLAIKFYSTIYESLKNGYFKKVFVP